jgi:hypothetical protein
MTTPLNLEDTIQDEALHQQLKALVLERMSVMPENMRLAIGTTEIAKEDIVRHVEAEDEVGKQMMELEYLRDRRRVERFTSCERLFPHHPAMSSYCDDVPLPFEHATSGSGFKERDTSAGFGQRKSDTPLFGKLLTQARARRRLPQWSWQRHDDNRQEQYINPTYSG